MIKKFTDLIELLEKLFGKGAVSRTIGTRTNVVRFPKGKQPVDPTTGEFRIEELKVENPDSYQIIKNSIEDRMGDISQMNDSELLNYTANVRRMVNAEFPPPLPEADVVKFGSGQEIKGKGLEELIEKQGTKNPPTTIAGELETQGKRLEKAGEDLKEITEQKPEFVIDDIMKDYMNTQKIMQSSQRTGYVRATVRQIMREDIQAGKLKLPKELQDQVMQGLGEPIDIYRKVYGEGALEQVDSLADDLGQFRTEEEAAKFARSKYKIEPKAEPVDESKTYEELEDIFKKGSDEPENKADGGRIGFNKGKKVMSEIDKLIEQLNKKTKGKKSMESVDPKTGEVTVPKKPIRKAEEPTGTTVMDPEPEIVDERSLSKKITTRTTADIEKEIDVISSSPLDSFEKKRKYNELHLEFIDSLDPRRSNKSLDYRRKTLDTENRLILKAEEKGLDFDTFEELRKGLYDSRKQKTLDFIKTGKVDLEPLKPVTTFEEAQERFKTAAKAADEIFPDYNQPKTAANTLAEVMAEQKYKKTFDQLSGDQQSELYEEAYNYITSINKLPKQSPKIIPEQVLEAEMNRVLNQYDKSMFVKNEFGAVDITSEENQKMMHMLLKRDHPELYNKIYNLGEDLSQKQILDEFDITGREPNASGGIAGLL